MNNLFKKVFLFFAIIIITFQPLIIMKAHAVEPWTGDSWEGTPWEGTPWEGILWKELPEDSESGVGEGDSWEEGPGSHESSDSPDLNNPEDMDRYVDDIGLVHELYSTGSNVFAGGLTIHHGYHFKYHEDGRRIIVHGDRNIRQRWGNSGFGNTMERIYYDERGIPRNATTYGADTDNIDIRRNINYRTNIAQSLNDDFGFRNQFKPSNLARGGGIVGNILTFGGNFVSYGVGENAAENGGPGMASTDFVAAQVTDGAIAAGTTVLSAAAGTAAASAAAGSVIPGVGTAVGAVVGLGIGLAMSTNTGRKVRDWTKDSVKGALDWTVDTAKSVGSAIKGLFSS